tara:strand:+ start:1647 stop:1865 length:219 start_codon:yes stop_codon:yes gene_type:complete
MCKGMNKIYERNPDTGAIRSRSYSAKTTKVMTQDLREDILSDIWAAPKKVVNGKWYVELSQVAEIIGGNNGE